MTVRRVMGTEVEYGVSLPGQPSANAMLLSAQVVNSYASTLPAGLYFYTIRTATGVQSGSVVVTR